MNPVSDNAINHIFSLSPKPNFQYFTCVHCADIHFYIFTRSLACVCANRFASDIILFVYIKYVCTYLRWSKEIVENWCCGRFCCCWTKRPPTPTQNNNNMNKFAISLPMMLLHIIIITSRFNMQLFVANTQFSVLSVFQWNRRKKKREQIYNLYIFSNGFIIHI